MRDDTLTDLLLAETQMRDDTLTDFLLAETQMRDDTLTDLVLAETEMRDDTLTDLLLAETQMRDDTLTDLVLAETEMRDDTLTDLLLAETQMRDDTLTDLLLAETQMRDDTLTDLLLAETQIRSSSKCLLEAMEPRIQLSASRPPVESADDVRHSCLLDRIQKNTMLYSDGALAWPKVSKEMRKGFRIKQVSHRNQEFLRGRNIGTQIADSRWKSLQSWLPKSVKTLYKGRLNTQLMVYMRSWQYRFQNQHKYLQTLGKLFKTKNAD